MSNVGSGSRVTLALLEESTFGEMEAGNFTPLRFNSVKLNLRKEAYASDEVTPNRQVSDLRHGFRTGEGTIDAEISLRSHDKLYEAALADTWSTLPSVGSVSATAVGNVVGRGGGSFLTDGYLPGDIVELSGFAVGQNNGLARVSAVTAAGLTLYSGTGAFSKTLVNDTGGTVVLKGRRLKSSTDLKHYSIEQGFTDVSQYRLFLGMSVNDMDLKIEPKSIAMVTFSLLGMDSEPFQGTAFAPGYEAASTSSPMDAFSGGLWEGGVPVSLVTGLTAKLSNGRTTEPVLGSKVTPAIFEGKAQVTGTATLFFQDAVAYNKFVNETESSIDIVLMDPNGTDFLRFVFPRVKFNTGNIEPPAEGPIPVSMEFQALLDPTSGTSFYMQRSNA